MSSTRDPRAGFTLAEVLIAAVIAGLFAIVLFNFVSSQSRFVRAQSAREEVGQNLRGALEIMSSELRAVPGGAIMASTQNSIVFRLPRVWGIYCGYDGASGRHHVVFPAGSTFATNTDAFPSDFGTTGTWGLAIEDSAYEGTYQMSAINDTVTVTSGTCVTNLGVNLTQGSTRPVGIAFRLASNPVAARAPVGSDVFVYHTVAYGVATTSSSPGTWLHRSFAYDGSNAQPLAGPLDMGTDGGLLLTYYCGPTALANATRSFPTDSATLRTITKIRVIMSVQSRQSTQSVLQKETDTLTVHLRNSGDVC